MTAVPMSGATVVAKAAARAARRQRLLSGGLFGLIACAALAWYASRNPVRPDEALPVRAAAAAEFKLPPLAIAMPAPEAAPDPVPAPAVPLPDDATVVRPNVPAAASAPVAAQAGLPQVPVDEAPVLWRRHDDTVVRAAPDTPVRPAPGVAVAGYAPERAERLPSGSYVLVKGSAVGCTLETAIESQLSGLATCVLGRPVYGADARNVLLPRGTRLLGEARSDTRAGQSRVYVLWLEARTPGGVLVPLASPATDALGRAGVPGDVDTHFFERFGAALLISVVDGATQAALTRHGGAVVVAPQASESVLTEILRNTVAVAPTIRVQPGTRLTVLVARDVDFSGALHAAD